MKLAVIFLCLSVASLIDITKGIDGQLKSLDKSQAEYYSREVYNLARKMNSLKTCPDSERASRQLYIVEDITVILKLLAHDTGCQLQEMCKHLGWPLELVTQIVNGNLKEVCQLLPGLGLTLNDLLNPVVCMLEGLLAKIGVLLKNKIELLVNLLGDVTGLLNNLPLQDSLSEVFSLLSVSKLGSLLGFGTGLLNSPLGLLRGLGL